MVTPSGNSVLAISGFRLYPIQIATKCIVQSKNILWKIKLFDLLIELIDQRLFQVRQGFFAIFDLSWSFLTLRLTFFD